MCVETGECEFISWCWFWICVIISCCVCVWMCVFSECVWTKVTKSRETQSRSKRSVLGRHILSRTLSSTSTNIVIKQGDKRVGPHFVNNSWSCFPTSEPTKEAEIQMTTQKNKSLFNQIFSLLSVTRLNADHKHSWGPRSTWCFLLSEIKEQGVMHGATNKTLASSISWCETSKQVRKLSDWQFLGNPSGRRRRLIVKSWLRRNHHVDRHESSTQKG